MVVLESASRGGKRNPSTVKLTGDDALLKFCFDA